MGGFSAFVIWSLGVSRSPSNSDEPTSQQAGGRQLKDVCVMNRGIVFDEKTSRLFSHSSVHPRWSLTRGSLKTRGNSSLAPPRFAVDIKYRSPRSHFTLIWNSIRRFSFVFGRRLMSESGNENRVERSRLVRLLLPFIRQECLGIFEIVAKLVCLASPPRAAKKNSCRRTKTQ